MSYWIDVRHALPEPHVPVLVGWTLRAKRRRVDKHVVLEGRLVHHNDGHSAWHVNGGAYLFGDKEAPTHWRPMPEGPY